MCIDDGLGISGRTGGKEKLCNGIGRDISMCGGNARSVICAEKVREKRGFSVAERIACDDQLDLIGHYRVKGARKWPTVIREHQPWRQQIDDCAQLSEVARHQRVGRRDRRVRYAYIHRREPKQRVFDVIAGQHDNRLFGGEAAAQQRGADPPDLGEHFCVGKLAPSLLSVALREEYPFRRDAGPMLKSFAEFAVVTSERLRGADVDDTSGPLLDDGIGLAKPHRPQWCGCVHLDV